MAAVAAWAAGWALAVAAFVAAVHGSTRGLCDECGAPACPGVNVCDACERAAWIKAGACRVCAKHRGWYATGMCMACYFRDEES